MYSSRITAYQDPLSWTFSKVILTPICELFIVYQPCSIGSDIYQAHYLCVIPGCFHLLHDGTMNFSSGLNTMPWHHSSWTGLPFLLSYFFMAGRFCINDVTAFVILFFILKRHHLFFGTSLHSSLLVGDYVCSLSYKSNAFVWLENFIRNIHTRKFLCINIWSCNYFSQYNIHPYLTKTF